jgi:nucleotide-binding universal stress UspA family protein
VVLVHVMQPFSVPAELGYMPPDLPETQQALSKSAQDELNRLCSSELGVQVRSRTEVREGVAWHEVTSAALENDADLIILATHGRTGLKHVLLGSVAERVVRHAPCPVLVVRERERDFVTSPSKGMSTNA